MSIFDMLQNPALIELMKDQRLRDLVTRREFRISEEYLHREFISGAMDDEVQELSLRFYDGYGEIAAKVKKRLIPCAIPFSARFSVRSVVFGSYEKKVHLAVEEVKPLDFDWVTKRVVERVPFLSFEEGRVVCDLEKVPRLADLLAKRVKGVKVSDFVTLKELSFRQGEVFGRVGVVL